MLLWRPRHDLEWRGSKGRANTKQKGEDKMSNAQENTGKVEITKRVGFEGSWETPAQIEKELRQDTIAEDSATAMNQSAEDGDHGVSSTGVFRFQELMAQNIERPKDIVEGLICERQNALLMGRFGVGKTMYGTQLSLHLAVGREFLGLKIPRPYRTMYLDFENDLGDMKERVSKQTSCLGLSEGEEGLLSENWSYVDAGNHENPLHNLKLDRDHAKLESLIVRLKEYAPEVLIIDNLGLVSTQGDLKDTEDALRFYDNLKFVRSKVESLLNGAIIVFHHLTKPGEQQGKEPISLLLSPYEYLSRARGTGRVLDFARTRLALAEEMVGGQKCHVVNGINRSAPVSPLILQFNPETLSFERHDNRKLRFNAVFGIRPKGMEIYQQLPEEFTFSDAEKVNDPKTGRPFNKGTLSDTLKIAVRNGFMTYSAKLYRKVFDLQSD